MLGAVEAHAAGSRVECNHAHTLLEATHSFTDFLDRAGQFMPEQRRRHNHAGVIAPLIHLQIRAASEGHVDLHQNFAVTHAWDRHFFNLDVFFAVKDGSRHLAIHSWCPSHALPGWMTIFIESGPGWAARFSASTPLCSGKRWLISRSRSISRFMTNRTDSSCNSTDAL